MVKILYPEISKILSIGALIQRSGHSVESVDEAA